MIKGKLKKQKIGTVKKLDILEKAANTVFLSIGSNLGNKEYNIEKTKSLIDTNFIRILSSSSNYVTPSWPNPNFPNYINIILKIKTNLNLEKLFLFLKDVESEMGRKDKKKNYPRTCDIDIIDFNQMNTSLNIGNNKIIVPHPRMHKRNFVLFPLFEVQNNWKHPKNNENILSLILKISIKEISTIKLM